jgi:hypothetical protein
MSKVIKLILALIDLDMDCLNDLIKLLLIALELKRIIFILEHAIFMHSQLLIESSD